MGTQNNVAVFKLPAVLDLAAAEGFLEAMRAQVEGTARLRLDASAVDSLTLPCAQIILAALQSQADVTIQRPSQAFLDVFGDFAIDVSAHCVAEHIEDDTAADEVEAAAEEISEAISIQPEPQAEQAPMPKRILTIDDSKTIRDMLRLTLVDAGFDVQQAVDGQEGVDILGKETFDVVITDINMPKMDGYGVIRHMRKMPEHDKTPILVLTTESDGAKRNVARDAGATGWLVKPFDPDQLVATINKVAP